MHIMKTRATLTLNPELHERAKRLAKHRRTSVSGLFESYLASQPEPDASITDRLIGSASLNPAENNPDPRRERLIKKYLK
jgi:hypothetical protein